VTQMIGFRGAASFREAGPAAVAGVSPSQCHVSMPWQCPASGSIHWQVGGIGPAPPSGGRTQKLQVPGLFQVDQKRAESESAAYTLNSNLYYGSSRAPAGPGVRLRMSVAMTALAKGADRKWNWLPPFVHFALGDHR
jgi:hypothetical protein